MSIADQIQVANALRDRMESRLHGPVQDPPEAPKDRRPAAVLGIVRLDEPSLLCIERPTTMRAHAGQVAFPGGSTDEGETALETALRETHEEIGVQIENDEIQGWLPGIRTGGSDFWITPFYAIVDRRFDIVPSPAEVENWFWVPFEQLLDARRHTPCVVEVENDRRTIDYWDVDVEVGRRTIWGATAALIRNFLHTVLDHELPKE